MLLIHGPNLNLLGTREPQRYGTRTLAELEAQVAADAANRGIALETFQSNHEGALIDRIHEARGVDGIIINAGALTHYSYALHDALVAVAVPTVEVHISNIKEREPWRSRSVTGEACLYTIFGRGLRGYHDALVILLTRTASPVTTVAYGEHEDQLLDLRNVDGPGRVAVLFHGGFWLSQWTRDSIDPLAADLARQGWTTANVEYRRGASSWEMAASDTEAAIAAVEAEVGRPVSVYIGHSAGGHLALWAAQLPGHTPDVAVGLAPITDLGPAAEQGIGDGAVTTMMGASPTAAPDRYAHAALTATAGVRRILVHGEADKAVPHELSVAHAAATSAELRTLPEAGHFRLLDPTHPYWSELVADLE